MKLLKQYVSSAKEADIVSKFREEYVDTYTKFLIKNGKISKNSVVVDVPCGTAVMARSIYSHVPAKFILIDINVNMMRAAKKNMKKSNDFVVGDGANIAELVDEKVDTIICLNGFHQYLTEKRRFLKGCKKILKKGGILIFDISTRGLNDEYSRKFCSVLNNELVTNAQQYGTVPSMPKWVDNTILIAYEKMITKAGLSLVEKKEFMHWTTIEQVTEGMVQIPGRSRPWLSGLDYAARKKVMERSIDSTVEKLGDHKMENNRVFYIVKNN